MALKKEGKYQILEKYFVSPINKKKDFSCLTGKRKVVFFHTLASGRGVAVPALPRSCSGTAGLYVVTFSPQQNQGNDKIDVVCTFAITILSNVRKKIFSGHGE